MKRQQQVAVWNASLAAEELALTFDQHHGQAFNPRLAINRVCGLVLTAKGNTLHATEPTFARTAGRAVQVAAVRATSFHSATALIAEELWRLAWQIPNAIRLADAPANAKPDIEQVWPHEQPDDVLRACFRAMPEFDGDLLAWELRRERLVASDLLGIKMLPWPEEGIAGRVPRSDVASPTDIDSALAALLKTDRAWLYAHGSREVAPRIAALLGMKCSKSTLDRHPLWKRIVDDAGRARRGVKGRALSLEGDVPEDWRREQLARLAEESAADERDSHRRG